MPSPLHARYFPTPEMASTASSCSISKRYSAQNWRASTFSDDSLFPPSSFTHSGHKAYNIEVDMARELITADPNSRPKHFRNVFEEFIFVFTVMMATACTTFIQGVININTVTIGRDLLMTPAEITWIAAAIGLSSGSFMLFFGKTADLFGRKIQIVSGLAFLSLTSLITAFSPTPLSFNILCGFLGLGTAIIAPPAIGLLFATYPEGTRRNRVTGALGAGNPIGFLLGSISSGMATRYSSWRASFYVLSCVFLILTLMAIWTMPAIPRSGNAGAMVRRFDYAGTVLVVVAMCFVSASLTAGPSTGWRSAKTISLLLFGIALLVAFVYWESLHPYPLLSPSIWKNKTFALLIACVGFGYMSFITNAFWIMLCMQDVQSITPLMIAVKLLPQVFAGIVWSYLGQYLISRWSGKVVMGIGGVGYVVGAVLIFFMRNGGYWVFLFPALCITVVGADFQFIVANLYISKAMPMQSSLGAGVLQTAMRLSISVGLSITSAAYGSEASTIHGKTDRTLPYQRAYVCGIIFSILGLCFVPFMKIGRQGKKHPSPRLDEERTSDMSLFCRGSGADTMSSLRYKPSMALNPNRFSVNTIHSVTSIGSTETWSQRWGSEAQEPRFCGHRLIGHDETMVYEVCTKCMDEQRWVQRRPVIREGFRAEGYRALSGDVERAGPEIPEQVHRHTWSGAGGFGPMSPLVVRDARNA
ncbi:related to aminotriazole resistance protein [Phialocephala subalpina]|uniref:Related to aminotriazole resistance protein n=1 Tax=Phialocephala subalpina TaxID=576137 RepID=A0A1L7XUC5_9HELO|nr:related to aminotriazole resistance protein [Phialocephala subalpina]